jgi:hypothetical protein
MDAEKEQPSGIVRSTYYFFRSVTMVSVNVNYRNFLTSNLVPFTQGMKCPNCDIVKYAKSA